MDASKKVIVWAPGRPIGQPRPRARAAGGCPACRKGHRIYARVYDCGAAAPFRDAVRLAAQRAFSSPVEGPLTVSITFVFPRPKAHLRTGKRAGEIKPGAPSWHTTKPDIDNTIKAALDALQGVAFADDSAVVCIEGAKRYTRQGEGPGALISVSPAPP